MKTTKPLLINETKDWITCQEVMEAIYWWPLFNTQIDLEEVLLIQQVKNPMVRVMYKGELMCEVHKSEILELLK